MIDSSRSTYGGAMSIPTDSNSRPQTSPLASLPGRPVSLYSTGIVPGPWHRAFAFALAAWVGTTARGGAEFRVTLGPSGQPPLAQEVSGAPAAGIADYDAPWNFQSSTYAGKAGFGHLGARTTVYVSGSSQVSGDNAHGGSSTVQFRFDDLVIRNLVNPEDTTPVAISLNFTLDGTFAFTGTASDRGALNSASIRVRDYSGYGVLRETGFYGIYADPTLAANTSGIFAGMARTEHFAGDFATPERLYDVGVPQVFGLALITAASANTSVAEGRMASADFMHTLGFTPGMPVFDLPDGYTAESADGRIVNNRFVPTAIPEPRPFSLAAVALLGLAVHRRWRSARAA